MTFHPDTLQGATLRYLFDLEWSGQRYYLSDGVYSAAFDGKTYNYVDGLDYTGNLVDKSDLFRRTPTEAKASMNINLAGLADVPARIASGHDFRSATGTLWIWAEGSTDREKVIQGEVREAAYGHPENPDGVEFMLVERPQDDRSRIPANPLAKILTGVTHTAPDDKIRDEWYPIVIGKPGNAGSGSDPYVYATPGQLIDITANQILVSNGTTAGGTVRVKNFTLSPTEAANVSVTHATDALGQRYAYVDTTAEGWTQPAAGDDLWVSWDASSGGIVGRDQSALELGGDIIEHFLSLSTLRYDAGHLAALKIRLNAYKFGGYIQSAPDERMTPWEFIKDEILSVLPVGARNGPEGLYFVLFDPDATNPRASLEAGRNCERVGAIVEDDEERYSEVRFSYEYRGEEDKSNAVAVVTGSEVTLQNDSSALRDPFLMAGLLRFGERILEKKSALVYDAPTAVRIASWMARRAALPSRMVEYDVDHELAFLNPGDTVELTDVDRRGVRGVSLTKVTAMVDERAIATDGTVRLTLRMWPKLADLRS